MESSNQEGAHNFVRQDQLRQTQLWSCHLHVEVSGSFPLSAGVFLVAHWVKNPPAVQEMWEMRVRSLDQEDPLEEGMATCSSILA